MRVGWEWLGAEILVYSHGAHCDLGGACAKLDVWACLPDLAEFVLRLLELPPDRLRPCEQVRFPGHDEADGEGMVAAVHRAACRADLPERRCPWVVMRALAPFGGFPREVMEVRPFWAYPVRLDGRRLSALIGDPSRAPLDQAVAASLRG